MLNISRNIRQCDTLLYLVSWQKKISHYQAWERIGFVDSLLEWWWDVKWAKIKHSHSFSIYQYLLQGI